VADPFPKSRQLARGQRRYRRKVASPKQWQVIIDAKQGPCRSCGIPGAIEFHHLVPRSLGGDDIADNIVPLCRPCHGHVTDRSTCDGDCAGDVARSLTDAEYAYVIAKLGEGAMHRLFGV